MMLKNGQTYFKNLAVFRDTGNAFFLKNLPYVFFECSLEILVKSKCTLKILQEEDVSENVPYEIFQNFQKILLLYGKKPRVRHPESTFVFISTNHSHSIES